MSIRSNTRHYILSYSIIEKDYHMIPKGKVVTKSNDIIVSTVILHHVFQDPNLDLCLVMELLWTSNHFESSKLLSLMIENFNDLFPLLRPL